MSSTDARDLITQLITALQDCKDDSQQVLDDYKRLYTETYRPERLKAQGLVVADANSAIQAAQKWLKENP